MPETPDERQRETRRPGEAPVGSTDAGAARPGSRSLAAGGEFLKAVGSDLTVAGSHLRRSVAASRLGRLRLPRRRPVQPSLPLPLPRGSAPAPSRVASFSGRVFVWFGIAVVALGTACVMVFCGVMLWLLYGVPVETHKLHVDTPAAAHSEAKNTAPLAPIRPLNSAKAAAAGSAGPPVPPPNQVAAATPTAPTAPTASASAVPPGQCAGGSCAGPAAPQPAAVIPPPAAAQAGQSPAAAPAASDRPPAAAAQAAQTPLDTAAGAAPSPTPDRAAGDQQQAASSAVAGPHPGMQCNVDLCAATYRSFHASDCTYQPFGGGPRSICAMGAEAADASPQTQSQSQSQSQSQTQPQSQTQSQSAPAGDKSATTSDTRVAAAAQDAAPARAGPQCNIAMCSARYRSFHAADCTYEPEGGGPRLSCGLGAGSADASAPNSASDADADADKASRTQETRVAEAPQPAADKAAPGPAGPQCNVQVCAATYRSFHAADCTYQPESGGPRLTCER